MRLLIIGLNFAPELTGVGKYTGEMAAWLAARGHDVSVITTRPYYPLWQAAKGLGKFTWRSETWAGCHVTRCPVYVPRHTTGVRRLLHLGSFAGSSVPAAIGRLGRRFDVVAGIVPTLLSAPIALAAARLSKAKAWLHVQDLEFDAAYELGIISGGRVIRGAMDVESQIMKRFDLVTAVSPKMAAALERKGVAPERTAVFPNWVDTKSIYPLRASDRLRTELGIPADACVALYAGSMGRKQGLQTVIAAAEILAKTSPPKLVFVLAGAGPARGDLKQAAAGLTNVRFLPLIPDDEFNAVLNMADIHILPQRHDISDLVMPSKLGPMLAVGKPVVATVPETSQVAQTIGHAGMIVPPENPAALADALLTLVRSPQRREAMGRIALEIAHNEYAADKHLPAIEARLVDLTGNAETVSSLTAERAA
ncbi:MAG TPA: WcaI family glycosyltransferase [Candidatus Binataceae bacterium]|nr:WcaI family glycosyltransferase [Candidatus Binataceae bacterium]